MKLKYVFLIVTSAIILNNCGGGSGDLSSNSSDDNTPTQTSAENSIQPGNIPTIANNEAIGFPTSSSSSTTPTDQLPQN